MELHELMRKLHKLELVQQLAHRRGAQEHGLYFGQMPVLDFIAANPGCTQVQVAEHLRVSPASIALSTKRLQKAGYLTKEVDAENLRCKRLYISEEGQRVCAMCRERLDPDRRGGVSGLFGRESSEAFSSFLDRVTLNMTGETENVVSGELFGHLCRELDAIWKKRRRKADFLVKSRFLPSDLQKISNTFLRSFIIIRA